MTDEDGAMPQAARATHEPSPDGLGHSVGIPIAIAEQVVSMGRVEWGATAELTSTGHIAHFTETLRKTREHFNYEDVPVQMHGLYLEGTETVLCHTGTSPNSGPNAQALAGAWNWLFDQSAQAIETHGAETEGLGAQHESAVAKPCAQPSPDAPQGDRHDQS